MTNAIQTDPIPGDRGTDAVDAAERAFMGALLGQPQAAADHLNLIDPRDYYHPRHAAIHNAMVDLIGQGLVPDHVTLLAHLQDTPGELARIGGHQYLLALRDDSVFLPQLDHYADLIRDGANVRRARNALVGALARIDGSKPEDAKLILGEVSDLIDKAATNFGPPDKDAKQALEFHTARELRERVEAQGPTRFLIRGIWPAGTHGVHGAQPKAQKTWNAFDLAVSVASGTPWLNHFEIDDPGPVLVFAGEGGEAEVLRRLNGIAVNRELNLDDLDITVCIRAPHLGESDHMRLFRDQLTVRRPKLVVLDPLYLAAKGADLRDLFSMGALLEIPQHLCADVDAALWVNHHNNRSRETKATNNLSGAGAAEWGRVIIGAKVISDHSAPDTRETKVLTELQVQGGAGGGFRVLRRIRAEDPDDLNSLLHYYVEVLPVDARSVADTETSENDLPPAATKLLEALQAHDAPAPNTALVDWVKDHHGHGLTRETTSKSLNLLADRGLADCVEAPNDSSRFPRKLWFIPTEDPES